MSDLQVRAGMLDQQNPLSIAAGLVFYCKDFQLPSLTLWQGVIISFPSPRSTIETTLGQYLLSLSHWVLSICVSTLAPRKQLRTASRQFYPHKYMCVCVCIHICMCTYLYKICIRCYSEMYNYGLCIKLQTFLVIFIIHSNTQHLVSLCQRLG